MPSEGYGEGNCIGLSIDSCTVSVEKVEHKNTLGVLKDVIRRYKAHTHFGNCFNFPCEVKNASDSTDLIKDVE